MFRTSVEEMALDTIMVPETSTDPHIVAGSAAQQVTKSFGDVQRIRHWSLISKNSNEKGSSKLVIWKLPFTNCEAALEL